jgi:hypothetical protein
MRLSARRHRVKTIAVMAALLALALAVWVFEVPLTAVLLVAVAWVLGYLVVRGRMPPKSHWPRGRS